MFYFFKDQKQPPHPLKRRGEQGWGLGRKLVYLDPVHHLVYQRFELSPSLTQDPVGLQRVQYRFINLLSISEDEANKMRCCNNNREAHEQRQKGTWGPLQPLSPRHRTINDRLPLYFPGLSQILLGAYMLLPTHYQVPCLAYPMYYITTLEVLLFPFQSQRP